MDEQERIIELLETIRKDTSETKQCLAVHIAESKEYRVKVDKHERVLFGSNGRASLMSRVDHLEQEIEEIKLELEKRKLREEKRREMIQNAVIGVLVAGVLTAIGYGIMTIIQNWPP